VLVVVGLTMGGTTAFYTYTTYMQKFLKLSVGLNDIQTTIVTATSLIFALVLQPIYGALSDRIGRKPLLIWFGVMGTLCTIPLLQALQGTRNAVVAWLLIAAAWLIVAGYTSINAVVKAELFPTKVRATGVGVPYAVTVSIFGGTAESLALWFKSIGHEAWFSYYLTAVIATSLIVYASMRDTRDHSATRCGSRTTSRQSSPPRSLSTPRCATRSANPRWVATNRRASAQRTANQLDRKHKSRARCPAFAAPDGFA
jgi:MHS family alpha-ketoglutarate permease-like MFS transporter